MNARAAVFPPRRIRSYVVESDTGLAPNITGGAYCTLAVCKPRIRHAAVPGEDWVLGFSTAKDGRNKLVYAMQVDEKLSYDAYFHDARFAEKKPVRDRSGDNCYRREEGGYRLAFPHTAAHAGDAALIRKDLSAPEVLVGNRFWYFGANAPELPPSIQTLGGSLALPDRSRRGDRVNTEPAVLAAVTSWLDTIPPGIHGAPRDAPALRSAVNVRAKGRQVGVAQRR